MSQELQIPGVFDAPVPQEFAALAGQDSLASGIAQSYGIIGYKGKSWTLRYRGEKKAFVRPDDGTPASYIDVVILNQTERPAKSYYTEYKMEQSEGQRPICASVDGLVPDADVQQKQSGTCALCPRNAWYKNPEGRNTRDCSDYKRLAVFLLPEQTQRALGMPLVEPVFLRVPGASLPALAKMGEVMEQRSRHYTTYITRVSFETDKPHPQMRFDPLKPLTSAEASAVLEMRASSVTARIIHGNAAAHGLQAVSDALAPPMATPAKAAEMVPDLKVVGGATPRPATPPPAPPLPASDTGVPDESNDELDAEIAKLFKPKATA